MEIPKFWGLKDTEEAHLKTIASSVWSIASERLKTLNSSHIIDCSISHSQRIIGYITTLFAEFSIKLNDYEKFVLACAVALHDIGMSANICDEEKDFCDHIEKFKYLQENHHLFSKRYILDKCIELGLACDSGLIGYIANISMYHHNNTNICEIQDTEYARKPMRLQLLASILRICDCLDCSFTRNRYSQLDTEDTTNKHVLFWHCHYFVQSVNFIDRKVKIIFRFSENDRNSTYAYELKQFVSSNIKNQISELYNILSNYNIEFHRDLISVDTEYMAAIKDISEPIKNYIDCNDMNQTPEEFLKELLDLLETQNRPNENILSCETYKEVRRCMDYIKKRISIGDPSWLDNSAAKALTILFSHVTHLGINEYLNTIYGTEFIDTATQTNFLEDAISSIYFQKIMLCLSFGQFFEDSWLHYYNLVVNKSGQSTTYKLLTHKFCSTKTKMREALSSLDNSLHDILIFSMTGGSIARLGVQDIIDYKDKINRIDVYMVNPGINGNYGALQYFSHYEAAEIFQNPTTIKLRKFITTQNRISVQSYALDHFRRSVAMIIGIINYSILANNGIPVTIHYLNGDFRGLGLQYISNAQLILYTVPLPLSIRKVRYMFELDPKLDISTSMIDFVTNRTHNSTYINGIRYPTPFCIGSRSDTQFLPLKKEHNQRNVNSIIQTVCAEFADYFHKENITRNDFTNEIIDILTRETKSEKSFIIGILDKIFDGGEKYDY